MKCSRKLYLLLWTFSKTTPCMLARYLLKAYNSSENSGWDL